MFNGKYKEFLRLFLYKNGLKCIHIKEDVIIDRYQCDFTDNLTYNKYKNVPIELIVNHRSMICNSLVTKELSNKEVINLVKNTIEKNTINNNQSNTIFYSVFKDKKSNSKVLQTCECDLNKEIINVINLIKNNCNKHNYINNPTVSTTVFPIWVTYSFMKMYYNNTYEFSTSVFVIEYLDCWNIIVVNNNNIIYNRSGLLDSFQRIDDNIDAEKLNKFSDNNSTCNDNIYGNDNNICSSHTCSANLKHIELTNTLNHIKNTYNIDIDDIIIYEFGEETIDSLTKYYKNNMKMISNINTSESQLSCKKPNNIIKIACFSCIGINCYFLLNNIYTMHNLLVNKNSNMNFINNCNKNLIKDFSIWNNLHNIYYYLKDIDYKKILHNYLKENYNTNHTDTLNSLHIQSESNNVYCNVNV